MNSQAGTLDYEDVRILIGEAYVSYEQGSEDPDTSFELGSLRAGAPLILYYEGSEGGVASSKMEEACAKHGVLTAGPNGSKIPLPVDSIAKLTYGDAGSDHVLFERFDPLSAPALAEMKAFVEAGKRLVVNCTIGVRHAQALANELRLAAAVLIGPTQPETSKRIEAIGLSVPRVSTIERVARLVDAPVIATAGNSADVCKALVAGADAALIHFGGPFDFSNDADLDFVVGSVVTSVKENIQALCRACGAKAARDLAIRCQLVAKG